MVMVSMLIGVKVILALAHYFSSSVLSTVIQDSQVQDQGFIHKKPHDHREET